MKKLFAVSLVISLSIFSACQKQETDAERQAEVDRQVQQKLDAEHQAQEKEALAQRQGELDAREKALAQKETTTSTEQVRERETQATRSKPRAVAARENQPTGSYNTFYTKLERYGDWRETSDYGYVWQPRQAEQSRSWRPYNDGRWAYTDAGWTWVSEEPFGWATYHYGRWTRLRNVGWVWVPGDEWAPAWVSWRKGDEYVGWAPLPPEARFDRRTGIHNWSDNYYDIGPEQYSFVETRQFGTPRAERVVIPPERNITIVNQTTNVTNITYNNTTVVNQGPSYDEIRARSQQPVERLRLERETNINVNIGEPRTVVRGEAVVIPAPLIARGQVVERPRTVKETIANVVVERGWEAITDRQAAEKVRVKMKAEATPPPDAPSKVFVKPTEARAEAATSTSASTPTATPTATASATVAATATPTPFRRATPETTPSATATVSATATPTPVHRATPEATPSATATVAATATPTPFHRATPETTPTPIATATPTPFHRATPVSTPTPSATATATPVETATPIPRPTYTPRAPARSTSSPSASPSSSPAASASASVAAEQSFGAPNERQRGGGKGRARRALEEHGDANVQQTSPAASPSVAPSTSPSITPAAEATASPSPADKRESKKEEKKKRKRDALEGMDESTATPSTTSSPGGQ